MVWKSDGRLQKSPSKFTLSIEDTDLDSYRSKVTSALIDNVIAQGMVGARFAYDAVTEEEANALMAETWKNPMNLEIKCPILGGRTLTAPFRCSKRQVDMIQTDGEGNNIKPYWQVSFSVAQKRKVRGQ
jgi:hypothetical protein